MVEDLAFVTHIDGVLTVVDASNFDASHHGTEAAKLQAKQNQNWTLKHMYKCSQNMRVVGRVGV